MGQLQDGCDVSPSSYGHRDEEDAVDNFRGYRLEWEDHSTNPEDTHVTEIITIHYLNRGYKNLVIFKRVYGHFTINTGLSSAARSLVTR